MKNKLTPKANGYLQFDEFIPNENGVYIYTSDNDEHRINLGFVLDDYASPLVEVLVEAKLQIEYLQNKFQETGSGNAVLSRIESALKNYEQDI